MSQNTKNDCVIYRCPLCLNMLNDVTIDKDAEGIYHCVKCGFHGDYNHLMNKYEEFRSRYQTKKQRFTLEDQRNL